MHTRFKGVEAVVAYDLPAFQMAVPNPPGADAWTGTLPRTHLTIGPTLKNADITAHT